MEDGREEMIWMRGGGGEKLRVNGGKDAKM
jgi:hypothetical protein